MKWTKFKEKPPDNGRSYLVCDMKNVNPHVLTRFYFDDEWYDENGRSTKQMFMSEKFTHYAEKPKLPRKEK